MLLGRLINMAEHRFFSGLKSFPTLMLVCMFLTESVKVWYFLTLESLLLEQKFQPVPKHFSKIAVHIDFPSDISMLS
jgi:hypothetical protein